MNSIKLRKKNRLEEGFTLLELMVVVFVLAIISVGFGAAFSAQLKNANSQVGQQKCTQPENTTKELVRYVEEYNVNNPNNQLGNFTIIEHGNKKYYSDTHPKLEDDAKFSLLVAKASACSSYKFETLSGNHFTIQTSKNLTKITSVKRADWTQVYDSRSDSH